MADQVPKPVVQERYERLVALVDDIAWQENLRQVGRRVEVMFADGEGRKDSATHRMSGRAQDNRLVHVTVPADPAQRPRPGDLGEATISYAAPHHLTADGGFRLVRTRGGDAWAMRQEQAAAGPSPVGLGLPTIGVPAPLPVAQACG